MVMTGCTEATLLELIAQCNPADLAADLARRISAIEGVRVEVKRLDHELRAEEQRHREAVARIKAERAEWEDQCPHPKGAREFPGSRAVCGICGKAT